MKSPYWQVLLAFLTCFGSRFCWCQTTPQAALEELVTTEKAAIAEKHYPEPVRKVLSELKKEDRAQMSQKLLVTEWLRKRQYVVQKNEQGTGWDLLTSGKKFRTFSIAETYFSGGTALVHLKVTLPEEPEEPGASYFVAMRLEAGDWQITGYGPWQQMSLESDEFAHRFTPTADNETAAKSTLRQIFSALMRYRGSYPQVGYPTRLQALSGPEEQEQTDSQADDQQQEQEHEQEDTTEASEKYQIPDPAPQYARILDSSFMDPHVVKDGYEFHYTLIDPGNASADVPGRFRITATPVEFGKTGGRSFLIDESGQIRVTSENRGANENDPILQDSSAYFSVNGLALEQYYIMR